MGEEIQFNDIKDILASTTKQLAKMSEEHAKDYEQWKERFEAAEDSWRKKVEADRKDLSHGPRATLRDICLDIKNCFSWTRGCEEDVLSAGFVKDGYTFEKRQDGFVVSVELSVGKTVLKDVVVVVPGCRASASIEFDWNAMDGYKVTLRSMPREYANIICDHFCTQ